jgi:hypothetical protein
MKCKPLSLLGLLLLSVVAFTACEGETDGPAAGEQFTPYNRLVREYKHLVTITYAGTSVQVSGAGADLVRVTRDAASPARLTVQSSAKGIAYFVSGKSDDGQLRIESTLPYALYLNGLTLRSTSGPALYSPTAVDSYVVLCTKSKNTLSDSGVYADSSACVYLGGRIIFDGDGTLTINSEAAARTEAGDTLCVHGLTARGGISAPYAVTLNVTAPGGDGIHTADSTLEVGASTYTVQAARHGLCSLAGNVTLDGGALYGTAATGRFVSAPAGRGLAISSGTCLAASAQSSPVLEALDEDYVFMAQDFWQQRVDTLTLLADTTRTVTAYINNTKAAQLSARPVSTLSAPYCLLSTATLSSMAEVRIAY